MEKYITFGTKNINSSLFRDIIPFNTKPYGGLWLTKYTEINANEWLMFLEDHPSLFFQKFDGQASIVILNDDANILYINNIYDFNEAYNKYPSYNNDKKILDYNKISKDYDGFYITKTVLPLIGYEDYCISSLILFNPYVIKSYQPIDVTYYKTQYYVEYEISKEYEVKKIFNVNEKFMILYNILKESFFTFINEINISLANENDYLLLLNLTNKFLNENIIYYENEINSILKEEDFEFINKNALVNGISHKLYCDAFNIYKGNERK